MLKALLEGYATTELLDLPDADFAKLNFHNQPLTFKVGGYTIIAQFTLAQDVLILEVKHLDPSIEGALPLIGALASRYAKRENLTHIDWRAPLLNCVNLNPKLRQILTRRGFILRSIPPMGDTLCRRVPRDQPWPPNTDKSKK